MHLQYYFTLQAGAMDTYAFVKLLKNFKKEMKGKKVLLIWDSLPAHEGAGRTSDRSVENPDTAWVKKNGRENMGFIWRLRTSLACRTLSFRILLKDLRTMRIRCLRPSGRAPARSFVFMGDQINSTGLSSGAYPG